MSGNFILKYLSISWITRKINVLKKYSEYLTAHKYYSNSYHFYEWLSKDYIQFSRWNFCFSSSRVRFSANRNFCWLLIHKNRKLARSISPFKQTDKTKIVNNFPSNIIILHKAFWRHKKTSKFINYCIFMYLFHGTNVMIWSRFMPYNLCSMPKLRNVLEHSGIKSKGHKCSINYSFHN